MSDQTTGRPVDPADCRALSLWRPWGFLTVTDRIARPKNPENRANLHTKWRGELYLHSSVRWDPDGAVAAAICRIPVTNNQVPNGYIGVATLVDVHHAGHEACSCDPFWAAAGAWHWVLENVRPFRTPVRMPGRQGLFRPDPLVVEMTPDLLAA